MDLEPAADDRIVGAAADEEEMVGIEDRAIGGAQPPKPVAELFALEFEQPFLTGGQRRTRGGVDDARRDISINPADRTALFGPMLAEIIDRPAGDRARKFGRAISSEEHTSEPQSIMRLSYAVFCMNK